MIMFKDERMFLILMFRSLTLRLCSEMRYVFGFSLGSLGVTCSPRDSRFEGSNLTEVDGFFQDVIIMSTSLPGGVFKLGVPSLRFQAR